MLRFVLASFGDDVGIGTTLTAALNDVLGTNAAPPDTGGTSGNTGNGTTTVVPGNVRSLLRQAEAQFTAAQAALQKGDLEAYAAAQARARVLVQRALAQSSRAAASPSPSPSASASPSP